MSLASKKQRFKIHLCIGDHAVESLGMWLRPKSARDIKTSTVCEIADLPSVDRINITFGGEAITFSVIFGAALFEEFSLAETAFRLAILPRSNWSVRRRGR